MTDRTYFQGQFFDILNARLATIHQSSFLHYETHLNNLFLLEKVLTIFIYLCNEHLYNIIFIISNKINL